MEKSDERQSRMAFDKDWQWNRAWSEKDGYYYGDVVKAMLGTGYTTGTIWSDGDSYYTLAGIELENGDSIVCITHNWFNK